MRATTIISLLAFAACAQAQDMFSYDFEQGTDFAAYDNLSLSNAEAEIVAPGADGTGHCLKLSTPTAGRYCTLTVTVPMPVVKNLVLSFDYRTQIEEGKQGRYVGIIFFYEDGKQFGRWDQRFSTEWRTAEIPFRTLRSSNEGVLEVGRELVRLNLYGRAPDEGAMMTVWLDNVRLARRMETRMLDYSETSYSNPPMFSWLPGLGASRLQYSPDPGFPEGGTVTVETPWNFHTPAAPVEPSKWYWRVWTETELAEGWSEVHQLVIPEEAHRFTTRPVDEQAVARRPRPRLIDVEAEREALGEAGVAGLVKSAESLAAQPVPDDPPIWQEGDERWPAWIDWYRDVHGGITSRTGTRMERMARYYAITGDDQVFEWTRELALAVAQWDPNGGSAMSRGDIGAQHVLRGLNACYDALHDRLNDAERARLREVIIARAEQFRDYLNPLRGNPCNNHAWLKALALGQSGLVLIGDHEEAVQWAEYVRQLYLGKFLCGMGYQGDNNEGIGYWSYGLGFIIEYADMMRTVCDLDLYEQPWLNQTARFPMYCAPPNAWAVSFADTGKPNHGTRGPAAVRHVRELAERTRDPYTLWYAGAREPFQGLEPRPPLDLPQSIHYSFIGWAILNTSLVDGREGVTFAMHSGPFYAGHQHADQNAFVIHAYGEKLAIDSGYYDWYGSPHFKAYSVHTQAHNCILVNGEGQAFATTGADGRMPTYFDSPAYSYVVGDASDPEVYGGKLTRFDRRALFIKPGIVVIQDLLDAPEAADFQWLLHTVAPTETDAEAGTFSATSGAAKMAGRFLVPEQITMEVTDKYPVHPYDGYGTVPVPEDKLAKEWHLTVTPKERAARQDFLTVFDVRRAEDAGSIAAETQEVEGGVGLRIVDGPRETTALLSGRERTGPLDADGLQAEAEAAAVTVADGKVIGAFGAAASRATFGQELFALDHGTGDFSILVTPEGTVVDLKLAEDARVRLLANEQPAKLLLDGVPAAAEFDAEGKTIAVSVRAGEHTLAYGRSPELALSHPLEEGGVLVGGKHVPLAGYARRRALGLLRNWWGQVDLPRHDRYELQITRIAGREPTVSWDGEDVQLTLENGRATSTFWGQAGSHHLMIGTEGGIGAIKLTPSGLQSAAARMLPADHKLPDEAIVVEAENVAAEGEVKGRIVEKVGASGGVGHCNWDTAGQWAEWQLKVPREGDYELVVRAATVYDVVLREILLDAEPLPGASIVEFTSTGGWCRTSDDWRYFLVCTPGGEPAPIHLAAGEHTLRMVRLEASMNLDLIALLPR